MLRGGRHLLGPNSGLYANALSQFAVCRRPWNEYISLLTKEDATTLNTPEQERPAYRGRKRGREGWLFSQQVQLHYRMYPDEHVIANLVRWKDGDTVGDIGLQQFRMAQPFDVDDKDPQGFSRPDSETYMKLNYKNAAVFSRYLTRTGHLYPSDILPMHPEAIHKVRLAKSLAIRIGLYPKFGNPFWHRSQQFRPKPYRDNYDPTTYDTRKTVEHFAYNWVQVDRIKRYFGQTSLGVESNQQHRTVEEMQQSQWYSADNQSIGRFRKDPAVGYQSDEPLSEKKVTTVPGLMVTKGMKRKFFNLYSSTSTKRMGFGNPVLGIKKI